MFQIPPEQTAGAVETAISNGYRLIDTAAVIGNEREVGEGIRRSGAERDQLFVTTKLWISDYGAIQARRGCEGSLKRLGLDYLDLLLLHEPLPSEFDATIAAFRALEQLQADGQVRAIGVSNFDSEQLNALIRETGSVPTVNQVEVHPFFTQRPLCEFHARHDIVTQAWSPLAGVMSYGERAIEKPLEHPVITALASRHAKTAAQVVLRWHIDQGRSAIPKSARPDRIAENASVFDFRLTKDEIASIEALDTGIRGGPDPDSIDRERYPFEIDN